MVEVAVTSEGERVALGIMNAQQALSLPKNIDIEISHPDHEAGATDTFIDREELKERTSRDI
ncbi:hypothetical protein [Rhizobium grahamii]|uniref:Uncharacterized protein n=1 Tax=Rhizobium grahamii CCGE 502 TaxID=990285 RepID=S3HT80_9HYPH|nr:hypothetical protein [Rhizobium grahamii]EPE96436.1 hypothetical protein RGCCGE502_19840 [Rhizobium grahamii CCGE 502]